MKIFFSFLFVLINFTANAQSVVNYPEDNPVYSITVPKGWTALEYKDYYVLEIYNGDQSIIYSLYDLQTALLFEAVKRSDLEAETEFIVHQYDSSVDEEINGITFHAFKGFGITEDDKRFSIEVKLFRINNNYYMIYYSAPADDIEYYRIELDAMNRSIQPY